jgi:hypothetical protein
MLSISNGDVMVESASAASAVQMMGEDSCAQRGYYLQLNTVATRIWEFLETPTRLSTLCERLLETFAVSPQACRDDVHEFLLQLQSNGVLKITRTTE